MTPLLFGILATTFIAGQVVAWRLFRRHGGTIASTLRWSAISGFAGFLTMIVTFLAVAAVSNLLGISIGG